MIDERDKRRYTVAQITTEFGAPVIYRHLTRTATAANTSTRHTTP